MTGQRQALAKSTGQTYSRPNATSKSKVLTALGLEKEAAKPSPPTREVTMTTNEGNGGTEQPAAETEAPAATEQQAAPQSAEPVAEQPPAEQAAMAPAEQAAASTS
jgi:hypothetical protein